MARLKFFVRRPSAGGRKIECSRSLLLCREITAVGKPATSILGSDLLQGLAKSLVQVLTSTSPDPAQERFDFGESPLDGREIGRRGGQKPHLTAFRFNGLADLGAAMSAQVIHHHDLTGLQAGS